MTRPCIASPLAKSRPPATPARSVHLQFALSFLARSQMLAGDLTAATLPIDETRLDRRGDRKPARVNAPDDSRGLAGPRGASV